METSQYFMYGVIISFDEYNKLDCVNPIKADSVIETSEVQGIYLCDFEGDNNVFVGSLVEKCNDGHYNKIPELDESVLIKIKTDINIMYGIHQGFDYYLINK